ncbi:MAG: hypothetical protein MUE40_10025 [Anaerolineae bacterium]|nr:hypothetical protein [Anaerolineae bacterium]
MPYSMRFLSGLLCLLLVGGVLPLAAQDTPAAITPIILNNNAGDASTEWTIEGERTLVMTGFDVSSLNIPLPFKVNSVSIALTQVTGEPVSVIVYQDPNGGSPIDAQVIGRVNAIVNQPGVTRFVLPQPASSSARIIWVGFYLPVGFRFQADTSGSSVLTYWAWTPGQDFNTDNLDRAAILGPSDGSEPVNINLGGVARITAEVTPPVAQSAGFTRETAPLGRQIIGSAEVDFSPMLVYPFCGNLYYDSEDVGLTANSTFMLSCRADIDQRVPGGIRNIGRVAEGIGTFDKGGYVYDVFSGNPEAVLGPGLEQLRVPVTHCMAPAPEHQDTGVLAVAYGAPKQWDILPTMRYANFICAEITHVGLVTYLVPRSIDQPDPLSANLLFPGAPELLPITEDDALRCVEKANVRYRLRNEGFQATPPTTILVRVTHVRSGTVTSEFGLRVAAIPPGTTQLPQVEITLPDRFPLEQYRITLVADRENLVNETNENDNEISLTFTLQPGVRCR